MNTETDTPDFFVGRREPADAELYVLTGSEVSRLRYGRAPLDWHGEPVAAMELSRAMLARLTGRAPSRRLAARFAVHVLMELPRDGFVLDAEAIWDWVLSASEPDEWLPLERPAS